MATAFSIRVDIGGKILPSLAGAVAGTKTQIRGLEAVTTGLTARIGAPFLAVQKHIEAAGKQMERLHRLGRNMSLGVTMPVGFGAISMVRNTVERDKAGNNLEALGGVSPAERRVVEDYADTIASKYGNATDILKTFNSMLKAGFSVSAAKGSIASILDGSIVADGEMSSDELANSVSKIVTQYGLSMKTVEDAAASSRRITDNLVFGANSTAASVKDMVEGYKFVGAAASAAGENIESTNALIIALSKAGQMGSEAGVALRSAYVKLFKPTKAGRATMAQLGLDYGNYVAGGKRTGMGVSSGLATYGYEVPARVIDRAMAGAGGSYEKQHRAIYAAVAEHIGAERASDTKALTEAVDGALTLSGGKADLTRLLIDLKKAGAGQGQLGNIFEGRQSVRMLSLLKADLPGILKDVNENAAGYSEKTVAKRQQGLEGATRRLSAPWQVFSDTLVRAVTPEIVGMMERLAGAVKNLAASSPATLKLGIGLTAAAAAAGPLMFALGAVGRVGAFALTALLTPIGLVSRGIVGLGVATAGLATAGLARLSAMAIGLRMLSTFGAGAMLSAMGASLLSFGRAVLLFPVTALRAIGVAMWGLVANPVGLIIGGLVAGLAALGVWVANNWSGVKSFFAGFGEGFMAGIGGANGPLGTMVGYLKDAATWMGNLLGPLGASESQWRSWGETLGGAVASGVNLVISGIQRLIGFLGTVVDKAIAAGSAIKNMLGFSGGVPAVPMATPVPISGARALGGPVSFGRPYLVGERGPELFVPGMSGRIETNNTLRRLTADGAAAVAGSSSTSTARGPTTITNNWTINGADNPREVVRQIDSRFAQLLRQMEGEQRGLLSD